MPGTESPDAAIFKRFDKMEKKNIDLDEQVADLEKSTAVLKKSTADLKKEVDGLMKDKAEVTLAQVLLMFQKLAIFDAFHMNKMFCYDVEHLTRFDRIVEAVNEIKFHRVKTADEHDFIACHLNLVKKYGPLADNYSPLLDALISGRGKLGYTDLKEMSKSEILSAIPRVPNLDPLMIKLIEQLVDKFKGIIRP